LFDENIFTETSFHCVVFSRKVNTAEIISVINFPKKEK